ncbi:MAG: 4-hydroxy-tetrahydrodipicolinate synthase [Ginsengibacter sp.]
MSLKSFLKGTGVALITPFKKNFDVDYEGLKKVIDYVIKDGVDYIVSLGTTGEASTISKEEKIDIISFTTKEVAGKVPVVVGIGGNNTAEMIKSLSSFPLDEAAAVLTTSPYYNKPSQEGIFQHYKIFSEASPKPVILYNVPARTSSNISAETTLRLANECANIGGIKEASGNIIQCMHILKGRPKDFMVVSGDDQITLPLIACGMDGVISVAANYCPKDFSAMVNYALEGNFSAAQALHYKLFEANELLTIENNPAGVKAYLSELGMIENSLRLPLVKLSAHFHEKIKAAFAKLF